MMILTFLDILIIALINTAFMVLASNAISYYKNRKILAREEDIKKSLQELFGEDVEVVVSLDDYDHESGDEVDVDTSDDKEKIH